MIAECPRRANRPSVLGTVFVLMPLLTFHSRASEELPDSSWSIAFLDNYSALVRFTCPIDGHLVSNNIAASELGLRLPTTATLHPTSVPTPLPSSNPTPAPSHIPTVAGRLGACASRVACACASKVASLLLRVRSCVESSVRSFVHVKAHVRTCEYVCVFSWSV